MYLQTFLERRNLMNRPLAARLPETYVDYIVGSVIGASIAALGTVGAVVLRHWLRARAANESGTPSSARDGRRLGVRWGVGDPSVKTVLCGARDSILFLGISNLQLFVQSPKPYRDWLDFDDRRLMGVLFLNPNSPHARPRKRRHVERSAAGDVRRALQIARERHARLIPAIYDGPYRYSARAVDIGRSRKGVKPLIELFTSSHSEGLSKGFRITLEATGKEDGFRHYQDELLDLWKEALANPPGHGASLVSRCMVPSDIEEREAFVRELKVHCKRLMRDIDVETDYWLFTPDQLHLTISALCRTQRTPEADHLSLASMDEARYLPEHFLEFVSRALWATLQACTQDLTVSLDRLVLNESGYMALESSEGSRHPTLNRFNSLLAELAQLREDFEKAYPNEAWNKRLANEPSYRFGPKYESFVPSITIGRAFTSESSLPSPLRGQTKSLKLAEPVHFAGDGLSVVHYAYPSLLRCIGEAKFTFVEPPKNEPEPVQLLRLLRF